MSQRDDVKPAPPRVAPDDPATRCPFCHDACAAQEDVRVCSRCLTRHHTACWGEGHGCGSCGATEALGRLAATAPAETALGRFVDAHKGVLLRWELLRIPYNAVLFGVSVAVLGTGVLAPSYFLDGVLAALAANLCYCLGPALEVYLRTLGARQRWVGPLLFAAGLLLSILVTLMACLLG
ncbi:MAG: hypothetical protein R3F62_17325 [Planctomycetota bacterium]